MVVGVAIDGKLSMWFNGSQLHFDFSFLYHVYLCYDQQSGL